MEALTAYLLRLFNKLHRFILQKPPKEGDYRIVEVVYQDERTEYYIEKYVRDDDCWSGFEWVRNQVNYTSLNTALEVLERFKKEDASTKVVKVNRFRA